MSTHQFSGSAQTVSDVICQYYKKFSAIVPVVMCEMTNTRDMPVETKMDTKSKCTHKKDKKRHATIDVCMYMM